MTTRQTNREGFTLVELAIVLVILGLLVGGVLVGQDLIKAAAIRSTTTDIDKYNAAVNTFRTKYGGIPGDLLASRAASFSLETRTGAAGIGDGNGLIEGGAAAAANVLGFENTLFWRDLSSAGLVAQNYNTADDGAVVSLATNDDFGPYIPRLKLRDTANIHVVSTGGRNNYYIASMSSTAAATGVITSAAALSPAEAKSIDEKTDDGLPTTGITTAVTALTATEATADAGAAAATGVCVNTGATPDDYNVGADFLNEVNCRILNRASF